MIGLGKEILFHSFTVLIQFSLVFDQQFSFEYFHNCSDHKVITRSMFRLTGMNVIGKMRPGLKVDCLLSRRLHPVCGRLKRDHGPPVLKHLKLWVCIRPVMVPCLEPIEEMSIRDCSRDRTFTF